MMQGFHPFRRNETVFQKTVAINDFYLRGPDTDYPLGQIQSQGRTHGVMAQTVVSVDPAVGVRRRGSSRGVDWLVMSEDLPQRRQSRDRGADGRIRLHYRPNNLKAHRQLVKETEAHPAPARLLDRGEALAREQEHHASVRHARASAPIRATSVLDPFCRTHDVENLFVVDASFFPSSAAVNPGLTIAAQALRVADHIREPRSFEIARRHET